LSAKVLRVLAAVWLSLEGIAILIGAIGLLAKGEFWAVFSPLNFVNWIVIGVIAMPAVALYAIADRIEKK
jgi:hypothetical protein